MFDFAKYKTFKGFSEAGARFMADVEARKAHASQVVLFAAVFHAANAPKASGQAVADGATASLALPDATAKNYRSQVSGAIAEARRLAALPVWDESVSEADRLAMCAAFVAKHTLRGLYDAYRAPISAKAEEKREIGKAARAAQEADAREQVGVKGAFGLDVLKLQQTVKPFMDAAEQGDANARAVLAALAASIISARADWEAPAQTEQQRLAA